MKKTFLTIAIMGVGILYSSLSFADEIRVRHSNMKSYSNGEQMDCNPGTNALYAHYGFETQIILNNGTQITARTCMDGPIGYRSAREYMTKSLSRIQNNSISFEKNSSQIVCFKTVGIYDSSSKVLTFDNDLIKCP